MNVELKVLGRCSLSLDGTPTRLGPRKALALVAVLALEGPRPREELAELLWGDLGEAGARQNLRKTVHRLRATPLADRLSSRGDLLGLHVDRVDALEQARLLDDGDVEAALALGTGPLLDGLDFAAEGWAGWLDLQRSRVRARQRAGLGNLAARREARGDLRGALDACERLLDLDEFDEAGSRAAMRLHLALGDRAGALRRFERLRRLIRPLGLEPEAATLDLARRSQAPPGPPGSPGLLLHAPLVGREADWLRLGASTCPLTVLVGEPGVGKSRLAQEFAQAHGAPLTARGRVETRHTPFSPVAGLLRGALEAGRWSPAALPEVWRLEVARLVPECVPEAPPPTGDHGRARFLEGLRRAVTGAQGGSILVLDDLHCFDEGSLELVSHLARQRAAGGGVAGRLVATARAHELDGASPAGHLLDSLRHDGLVEVLPVEPLAEPDVLALVQALSGAGGGMLFARRLHAATRGNPLYLLEVLRGLFESGELRRDAGGWSTPYDDSTRDYAELPLPANLRETVLARVRRLGPAAQRLLEAAALAGESFESAWLAEIEPSTFTRLDALEAACRAGLLEAAPPGLRFRHDLLRRALGDSLGAERRRALHASLAGRLAALDAPPGRVAHHLEAAGQAAAATPYLERAAAAAGALYAHREALAYTERALGTVTDPDLRWPLELRRVALLQQLTDLEAYREGLDRLEGLAETLGDVERRASAYLQRARFELWRGHSAGAAAQARRALTLPGLSAALEAEALYLCGHGEARLGHLRRAGELLGRALDRAGRAEGGVTMDLLGFIENGLLEVHLYLGDYARAWEHSVRAHTAFGRVGETRSIFSLIGRNTLERLLGRLEDARLGADAIIALALEHGHASAASFAFRNRAQLDLAGGDARAAEEAIDEGLRRCAGKNLRLAAQLLGLRAERCWLDGEVGGALGWARESLEQTQALHVAPLVAEGRVRLAGFLAELGAEDEARAQLGAARRLARDLDDGGVLQPSLALLETVAARLDLAAGRTDEALARLSTRPGAESASWLDAQAAVLALGRARLRAGDARGALEVLPADLPPPLAARALDTELGARLRLGRHGEALALRALAALGDSHAPPLDRLDLAVTLLQVPGLPDSRAEVVRTWACATLEALCASLEAEPDLGRGLRARFPLFAPAR